MIIEIKQHIELRGDNPLAAVMIGTNKKVYLVASLALNDGIEAAAEIMKKWHNNTLRF
jgi:hypothetical protein